MGRRSDHHAGMRADSRLSTMHIVSAMANTNGANTISPDTCDDTSAVDIM